MGAQKRHFGSAAACAAAEPPPGWSTAAVQIHNPNQLRMQMDRKPDSAIEIAMQQLMERDAPTENAVEDAVDLMAGPEGTSPTQALLGAMLSAAMLIERERHLGADPHERAEAIGSGRPARPIRPLELVALADAMED